MSLPVTAKVPFGGDYNPEQWPEDVWEEDYRLFDLAGIDTVTIGVFVWALTQPAPEVYDFTMLDRIVERATARGRDICLATGTGAHPAWLARAFPEVTRVDFEGRKHRFGQRHNSCPSSPVFQRLSAELARRVAQRYAGNPRIVAWHVGNEYGGACYCDLCAQAFRQWLRDRYSTLDALNAAWYTTFWSHVFTAWEEIEPLLGVRVGEWDSRGPEVVNPVRLRDGSTVEARLLFELVQPVTAEVMGTYQRDFYAGTAAVTRNPYGAGEGWYAGAGLDQAGVGWVIGQVLRRHGLAGPYADLPELECARRVTPAGEKLIFLLNHGAEPVEVPAPGDGTDLLTGRSVKRGESLRMRPTAVHVQTEEG